MEAAAAVAEEAEPVEQLRRSEAVSLHAALDLRLCFAQVGEGALAVFLREGDRVLHALHGGGVLGVDAETVGHERIERVEAQIFPLDVLRVRVEVVQSRADHRAEAAVDVRAGVGLVFHVHVEGGRNAGGEVFEDTEPCKVVDGLFVELRLVGPDLLGEPLVQRHVVRERAQEDHGRVRVRVLEAGHQDVAAQVDLPLEGRHFFWRRADMDDLSAVGPDLVGREMRSAVETQRFSVVKAYHGVFSENGL